MDKCPLIPCNVNDILIKFDPDTGSQLTLMGKNHYATLSKQLGYSPKLQTVKIKGTAPNETPMPFIGYFSAVLKSKHSR